MLVKSKWLHSWQNARRKGRGGIEMDCLSASQQKKKDPVISFYKQDKVTSLEDSRKMTSETISLLFFIL